MKIEALPLSEMRGHRSEKWRGFAPDVLPLFVAEMDFPIAKPIQDLLVQMVSHSDLGYLGSIPELGTAFKGFAKRHWNWDVNPEYVRLCTDVGVGMVEVLRVTTKPGDKVLINSPIYQNFYNWIKETHVELLDVPFIQDGMQWSVDFENIEAQYANGVKVHALCHPHNPLGRIYTKDELIKLAALAKKYGVTIISDEIHAPLTYSEKKFIPFLSVSQTAKEVGITITSASKAFNLAGLKCAMIITENESLRDRINVMPLAVAFRASLFGATAATAAFQHGLSWLESVLKLLDENRKLLKNLIDTKLPGVGYRIPDFGYLGWIDLAALNLGDDPCERLLERGRVALVKGSAYGPQHQSFARFNFGTNPEIIAEAVDRIAKSI